LSWTEEDRLLLYFCRKEIDVGIKNRIIKAKKNNLDWDGFLKKARENGVSAVVYSRLNKIKKDCPDIPSSIFKKLKKDYFRNAANNALIFEELAKVLETFKKAGLRVVILKGAVLAEKIYGNLALRPMADIDLLTKKEDLIFLDEQMKILGYRPSDISVKDIDISSTYLTTLDYRNLASNSPSFHIHWHFVNSTIPNESYINNIKIEDIWRDAEKTKIANVETLVMAPHHLLIHLSEHALRVTHSLSKLSFFCDIDEAVNFYQERLDWERLIKESFKFNLSRMVYPSLYFTSKFLKTKIQENVLSELRPKRLSLGERIFIKSISNNKRFPGLSYLVHLSMNNGLLKKMRFLGRTLFPPPQIMAQRSYIPRSRFSYMHYIQRITEVLTRLAKTLSQSFILRS
jgi:hypothetical protein